VSHFTLRLDISLMARVKAVHARSCN